MRKTKGVAHQAMSKYPDGIRGRAASPSDPPSGLNKEITTDPRIIVGGEWTIISLLLLYGVFPSSTVQRFSQAQKYLVNVSRPNPIDRYNSTKGEMDLMDENLNRGHVH